MTVQPVIGESTVFLVASRSVQCPGCTRRFDSHRKLKLQPGDLCPKCGAKLKRMLPHRVDVARVFPIGQCACWHGAKLMMVAERLTLKERIALAYEEQEALRCWHVKKARHFWTNRELSHFEKQRLKGRSEERQP